MFLDEDGGEEKTVRGEEVNSHVKKKNYKVYKFVIWEVKYGELLEMNYFFHLSYLLPSC